MLSFFENIASFLGSIVDFIVSVPTRLVQIFGFFGKSIAYLFASTALLPPALLVFVALVVAGVVINILRDVL